MFPFSPTNDIDKFMTEKHEAYPYIQAYRHGQDLLNCIQLFEDCEFPLVDMFSQLHNVV